MVGWQKDEVEDIEAIPESYQKYIDEIYKLSHNKSGGWVTNKELAESLKVEPSSITGMLHKLKGTGLINWTPRRAIRLTKVGKGIAMQLSNTHSLLRQFFQDLLEIKDINLVEKITCDIEHHITERVQKSLKEFIDYFFDLKKRVGDI